MTYTWRNLGIGVALAIATPLYAFEFVPSDAEFYSWPEYCRARYVTVPGLQPKPAWIQRTDQTQIDRARQALGNLFDHVHHYCAGTTWLNRARVEQDLHQRDFQLRSALSEMQYTSKYTGPSLPLFAEIMVGMATAHYEAGNDDQALDLLSAVVSAAPESAVAYSAIAVIYRSNGRLSAARDMLVRGDEAVGGTSAEILYNLGLVQLELKQPELALESAKRAYVLGYPLPGLRRKLERLGYWRN